MSRNSLSTHSFQTIALTLPPGGGKPQATSPASRGAQPQAPPPSTTPTRSSHSRSTSTSTTARTRPRQTSPRSSAAISKPLPTGPPTLMSPPSQPRLLRRQTLPRLRASSRVRNLHLLLPPSRLLRRRHRWLPAPSATTPIGLRVMSARIAMIRIPVSPARRLRHVNVPLRVGGPIVFSFECERACGFCCTYWIAFFSPLSSGQSIYTLWGHPITALFSFSNALFGKQVEQNIIVMLYLPSHFT